MSDNKLSLEKRTLTGKKLASLRADGLIPSVVYGGERDPILGQSAYNETEKALRAVGYHSTIDLDIAGKTQLAIVKDVAIDPVSRRIMNVEFQAVSADKPVEATAPITIVDFESSEANKLHFALLPVMEEIDVKAKPADLPKEIVISAAHLAGINDRLTVADIKLPKGVELADKEIESAQVVASLYDPAAEAAAREAEEAKAEAPAEEAAEAPAEEAKPAEEKSE